MRRLLAVCILAAVGLWAAPSRAENLPPPTVFDGAYQGLLVGATAGLATGYLFARSNGWNGWSDGKTLIYGAGIGALGGAAIGLGLGIVDMSQSKPGRNGYVMRDGLYGAMLGAVLGGIAGGLAAMSSKKGEHILLGGSIGILSGTCLGMTVGFIEGYRRYAVAVAPVEQADGSYAFVPSVAARF
jgi:hypothetical protein